MSEVDVDAQIKNYWDRIELVSENEEKLKRWEEDRFGGSRTEFFNPNNDHPMRLALFLSFLDCKELEEAMKPFYKRPGSIKYLRPMGLSIGFMVIKCLTTGELANHLKTYPADAELLGYEQKPDGSFQTPSGECFRYNIVERFKPDGMKKIDRAIRRAVNKAARELGLDIGEEAGCDAFAVESVENDNEAEYSAHKRIRGYKAVVTSCHGDETGIVPLAGTAIGINDDEGKELLPHIYELKEDGIVLKDEWVDGKFATIDNIGKAEVLEKVRLHYDIAESWVYNHEATLPRIKEEYQKFHREPDFQPGAPIDHMMEYLVGKGKGDVAAHMLRNGHIAAKEEAPDGYMDDFHRRNITESENDFLKNDLGLQKAIRRKGKWTVELKLQLGLFAIHLLVLTRLRNGAMENLASKQGLT